MKPVSRFWIVYNAWWMFWARGMVLWPFVLLKPQRSRDADLTLFRHELEHVYQIQKLGVIKFYWRYLQLHWKWGYADHPFEEEAREKERVPLTWREMNWYETGKIRIQ